MILTKSYRSGLCMIYFLHGKNSSSLSTTLGLCSPRPHPCSGYRCPACPRGTAHTALPEASPHTPPLGGRGWARRRGGARCPPYLKTGGNQPVNFLQAGWVSTCLSCYTHRRPHTPSRCSSRTRSPLSAKQHRSRDNSRPSLLFKVPAPSVDDNVTENDVHLLF